MKGLATRWFVAFAMLASATADAQPARSVPRTSRTTAHRAVAPRDLYRVGGRFSVSGPRTYGPIMVGYGGYPVGGDPTMLAPEAPAMPETGMLRLSVTPISAQVFADWYYVGTVEDIDEQHVLTLPAGPHRIEIRAPGYEMLTFDVRIDPSEMVRYRGSLESVRPPASRPPATTSASLMYVIPNCYAGNVPPRTDRLPAGCSVMQVRVIGDR